MWMDRMCDIRMRWGDKLTATTSAFVMRLGRVYPLYNHNNNIRLRPIISLWLTLGHMAYQSHLSMLSHDKSGQSQDFTAVT